MPVSAPLQPSFARGELSPRLNSRVDLQSFHLGLARGENVIVMPHGGFFHRPGTKFIQSAKFNASEAHLKEFVPSLSEASCLEFGNGYVRFFRNQARVKAPATDGGITNGDFPTDLTGWTAVSVSQSSGAAAFAAGGTLYQAVTVTDPTILNVLTFDVIGDPGETLSLKVGTSAGASDILAATEFASGYHSIEFTPGAGNTTFYVHFTEISGTPSLDNVKLLNDEPLEIGSPYTAQQAEEIHRADSADIVFWAHADVRPYELVRNDHLSWSLISIKFTSEPSDWAAANYPRTVAFFEDRLCWAGTAKQPLKLYLSKTGDYRNHTTGSNADDAMEITLNAARQNKIQWIVEGEKLEIGVEGAVRSLDGAGAGEPIAPDSIKQKLETTDGASRIQPVRAGRSTLFIGRYGRRMHEFAFQFAEDGFRAPDLSILSEHITKTKIRSMAITPDPVTCIWMVRNDGQLVTVTYEREQEVVAPTRQKIAGGSADTYAKVISVAAVPGADRDELWISCQRTIGGQTVQHIEVLEANFESEYDGEEQAFAMTEDDMRACIFVDACLSYDEVTPGTTFSGLDHLEGEGVSIFADGAVVSGVTVTAGDAVLPNEQTAKIVHAGLGRRSYGKTLRPEVRDRSGSSSIGKDRRVSEVAISMFETVNLKIGRSLNPEHLETVFVREDSGGNQVDAILPLFTGDKTVKFSSGWSTSGQVYFVQDDPLPFTIQGLAPKVEVVT